MEKGKLNFSSLSVSTGMVLIIRLLLYHLTCFFQQKKNVATTFDLEFTSKINKDYGSLGDTSSIWSMEKWIEINASASLKLISLFQVKHPHFLIVLWCRISLTYKNSFELFRFGKSQVWFNLKLEEKIIIINIYFLNWDFNGKQNYSFLLTSNSLFHIDGHLERK